VLPAPTPANPRKNQRFLYGHQNRNNAAFRAKKAEARTKPPKGWEPPTGYCECGCGSRTSIAKSSSPSRGYYFGYPKRFAPRHHVRVQPRGELSNKWRGGRYIQDGYVMVYDAQSRYRYVPEHRLVWEKAHGPIPARHHIHHINGVRADNRLENLACLSMGEHKRLHQHGDLPAHNHFLTDTELIDAFIALEARLGRPPIRSDFSGEARKANDVPEWSTYHRRFGGMPGIRQAATSSTRRM